MIKYLETARKHHFIDRRFPALTLAEHCLLPVKFWPLLESIYTDHVTLSVRRKEEVLYLVLAIYCAECLDVTPAG